MNLIYFDFLNWSEDKASSLFCVSSFLDFLTCSIVIRGSDDDSSFKACSGLKTRWGLFAGSKAFNFVDVTRASSILEAEQLSSSFSSLESLIVIFALPIVV